MHGWQSRLGAPVGAIDTRIASGDHSGMTTTIEIRNVPEALHQRLETRAALAGKSLSDYLLREISRLAAQPTPDELRARLRRRPKATVSVSPAEAVRAERLQR